MRNFDGEPIFTRRFPITVKFKLSDAEKELYNDVSRYIIEQYKKSAKEDGRKNVAFALVILQCRMASSVYALLRSLRRRKEKLEGILKGEEKQKSKYPKVDIESLEDLEESERWEKEQE